MATRDRSILAEIYIDPWLALFARAKPADGRLAPALLSGMLWLMSLSLLALVGLLGGLIVENAGQPTERREATVVRRVWRPAEGTLTVQPVITTSGQVTTAVVPDHDPERYEVCLQIGDQQPCARVRPARFEALRPGVTVIALVWQGRITGRYRVSRILDDEE